LVKGTDSTYQVGDLLRQWKGEVLYDDNVVSNVEQLPFPGGFLVHNLLTAAECEQYIRISEDMDYEPSPLRNLDVVNSNSARRGADTQSIRNSLRVLTDAPAHVADTLNARLLPHLPQFVSCEGAQWEVYAPECINSRWRFNRYDDGNYFKPHFDAGYVYSEKRKTIMSFILYLNDGFDGGETRFFPGTKKYEWSKPGDAQQFDVVPRRGSALVFFQAGALSPRHEGVVICGPIPKYILRSDLTYHMP